MNPMSRLGWDAALDAAFGPHAAAGLVPARVLEPRRDGCLVATAQGESVAHVSGRSFHEAASAVDHPVAGDFVALEVLPHGAARIRAILPRRSAMYRRAVGRAKRLAFREVDVEAIVANVDHVLILSSLNLDFSPRRIERYVAQIWEGGAQPVAVLTKADLCDDSAARCRAVEDVAPGVPVHAISAVHGDGLDDLAPYFAETRTAALVGSSGVGKSTLVNALLGGDVQVVRDIRGHDETGVHTTTARKLFLLPGRGCLIDTPGMRELGVFGAEDGLDATFADVAELAPSCRFRDCSHENEPGCAVLAAVEGGTLPADRIASFRQLRREMQFVASKDRKRERALRKGQVDARRVKVEQGFRGDA